MNSQSLLCSKTWCEIFVLKLSGIQIDYKATSKDSRKNLYATFCDLLSLFYIPSNLNGEIKRDNNIVEQKVSDCAPTILVTDSYFLFILRRDLVLFKYVEIVFHGSMLLNYHCRHLLVKKRNSVFS